MTSRSDSKHASYMCSQLKEIAFMLYLLLSSKDCIVPEEKNMRVTLV